MSSRWGTRFSPLLIFAFAASVFGGTSTYKLDFGTTNSPLAEGFQAGDVPTLQETADLVVSVTNEKGAQPIEVQFGAPVGGFSLGNTQKPLTTDGIYTFGSNGTEPKNVPFTIKGLPPKSLVTLYAVKAWNGDSRAAFVSLGESGLTDLAGIPENDAPCDSLAITDMTKVAENVVVGPTGSLTGSFSNSDGTIIRAEGQWGGMILVVETK